MKGGDKMPTGTWLVKWKKNRNNREEEIVHGLPKAVNLAEEKKKLGYKVSMEKVKKTKKKK